MEKQDGKLTAQKTWGNSPAGTTSAKGAAPGTKEFFDRALKYREEYEQPWLPEVVPFHTMAGKRVLEIGFGAGFDTYAFMRVDARYTGIDITPENPERARQHMALFGYTPDVRQGDAESLSFDDGAFDAVYSNGVLHHVPSIETAFSEVARVLKPGGDFYVILYHKNSVFYRVTLAIWYQIIHGGWRRETLKERLSRIEYNETGETPIVNVYSRSEVRRLLQDAGLEVRSIKVRKLVWEELPSIWFVHRYFKYIPRGLLSTIGKAFGWYVIGHAVKPPLSPHSAATPK